MNERSRVVIVGGGFAGLNACKGLRSEQRVEITLIDRRNHHLFQPLLYQVAMAGLSPAEIATPIRSLLSGQTNARVFQGEVRSVDFDRRIVAADFGEVPYDYLLLACGARHSYFGHNDWEPFAPGLKTIEQATEIRRRVLSAFEEAERSPDAGVRRRQLTFVVVGGGPTGVELAGAIGEMSRFTLARDFRNIDSKLARIFLVEAGPRILPMFSEAMSGRAMRDLENLGVQVWTSSRVSKIDSSGVEIGSERIEAATVLWAAGVEATRFATASELPTDRQGRVIVNPDLSVGEYRNVFVAGDQACFRHHSDRPLPGVAPVALQQGRFVAQAIVRDLNGQPRAEFQYVDKGQLATIGRSRAIATIGRWNFRGFFAWWVWLVVHIYYLTGFRNRFFVVVSWAWSYFTFRRGARLIVGKEWRNEGPRG
ncbi:MAG: NAD(P)/FAD-dependent oxidoreductase [Planctomycetota bacterium]|nr:MAG: NAD(P)/FAD-dependent oxidoreductase [Planctomycetota bacterium]REJ90419.1 MAG: NAD(P)/FAD-dependent oxidoreductase [Planctomycetota bacterium]REK20855.1 MAG: NAD(P)/FAD-dependent oxidoreductase [Planctomycetota bacterium]REK36083.1 MAG: NAD(P)/FAD-dependent oxidoreductase [Planctomycetota bacterium]